MDRTVLADSATKLKEDARDAVVVCGSHGGLYPAWLAARAGVRAIVLNDAGVGRLGLRREGRHVRGRKAGLVEQRAGIVVGNFDRGLGHGG